MNDSTSLQLIPARQRLAANLRLRRLLLDWSQEILAEQAGLDRSYVSSLERAERNVSLDVLERLAKAFQVEIGDLLIEPDALILGEQLIAQARRIASHRNRLREVPAVYAVSFVYPKPLNGPNARPQNATVVPIIAGASQVTAGARKKRHH